MGERGLGPGGGSGLRRILGGVFLVGGGLDQTYLGGEDGRSATHQGGLESLGIFQRPGRTGLRWELWRGREGD